MRLLPLILSIFLAGSAFAKGNAPFLAYQLIFPVNDGWDASTVRDVLDMNNDGRTDVAGINDSGAYVSLSTTSGFSDMKTWSTQAGYLGSAFSSGVHKPRFRDVNGDGLPDLISFGRSGVYVALSDGTKFATPELWTREFVAGPVPTIGNNNPKETYVDAGFVAVRDFDGDQKADLLVWTGVQLHLALSTGTDFDRGKVVYRGRLSYPNEGEGFFIQHIGDLDGDARADLLGAYFHFDPVNSSKSVLTFATLSNLPSNPELKFVDTDQPPGVVVVGRFTDKTKTDIWTLSQSYFGCVVVAAPKKDVSCDDTYFLDVNVEGNKQGYVGDFSKDGRDDIAYTTGANFDVVVSSEIETNTNGQRLLKNKKSADWMSGPWDDVTDVNDLKTYPIFTGDFNADGNTDFARFGDQGVSFSLSLGN